MKAVLERRCLRPCWAAAARATAEENWLVKAVAAEKGSRLPALANGRGRVSEKETFQRKI